MCIVDDIDMDGFGSAKIAYSKLKKYFRKCNIYINNQHGFTDIEEAKKYDVILILDSSSNLLPLYKDLGTVFILDHHEYDHNIECPDNVFFINSKDTKELENISAGMLTYLVTSQLREDIGEPDDSMFDIACATLYSDIVPTDDYVQSCLYKLLHMTEFSSLISNLNIYRDNVNHNTLGYTIIPLINYTRRLNDTQTLNLLYEGEEEAAMRKIVQNKSKGKNFLRLIESGGKKGYVLPNKEIIIYNNFVYWDISQLVNRVPQYAIANFKGVYANQLAKTYGKPALVGFNKDGQGSFSVRSPEVDSLAYFSTQSCIQGGGHKKACGFTFSTESICNVLSGYDDYLSCTKRIGSTGMEIRRIDDLAYFDLFDIAVLNEFRYSNYSPISFLLKISNTEKSFKNVDKVRGRFTVGIYSFYTYDYIPTEGSIIMEVIPTLSSFEYKSKNLLCRFREVNNE